jgi:hypothetical protein
MTSVQYGPQLGENDATADLAVQAWGRAWARRRGTAARSPTGVVRLKRQRREWNKTAVYRLEGVAEDGSAVIAKRCLGSTARVEREVYETLLPRIAVPRLDYFGYFEDEDRRFAWLFLGDAGDAKPAMADRDVVAEWLARLECNAARLSPPASLPDRGPDYFLGRLPAARAGIAAAAAVVRAAGGDGRALDAMAEVLHRVESRWDRLAAACAAWPRTLVHADLSRKNVRVCRDGNGVRVFGLDWETAGWGPPAADVAAVPWGRPKQLPRPDSVVVPDEQVPWYGPVSLEIYAEKVAACWPGIDRAAVERLSQVGAIFRVIDAVCWASRQVEFGGLDKGGVRLSAYAEDLRTVTSVLDI